MTDSDLGEHSDQAQSWEAQMRSLLEEGGYDIDLGIEMARDAQRLVAGELSEQEFHERYHAAVTEEFGTDERPVATDEPSASFVELLTGECSGGEDPSRREVVKALGVAGGALGLGGMAVADQQRTSTQAAADGPDEPDIQYGMVVDLERCDGCLQCVTACADENQTSNGANWMYVLAYLDEHTEQENFLVRPCQHCSNAPCEKVCPVRARHTREQDGIVLTDYDACIGCRYCQVACPYGVNYFQWGDPEVSEEELDPNHIWDARGMRVDSRPPKGVMGKCTFCPTRQDGLQGEDKVGTVACMDACDAAGMRAIHFGDLNNPESRPRRYLRERAAEELDDDTDLDMDADWATSTTRWRKLSAFRLLEDLGTEPNVIYLGNQPGERADQQEGPVPYDLIGRVDRRKDVLDERTVGITGGDD